MYDLIIKNGLIVDGTGKKPFKGDVAIKDDVISCVSSCINGESKEVIDARELIVAPGFIDTHSHNDLIPFMDEDMQGLKLAQGVTTELIGQCGLGAVPCVESESTTWKGYVKGVISDPKNLEWNWPTFQAFMDKIEKQGVKNNYAALISHGAIRSRVMGFENREATEDELKIMESMVQEAMEAGAFGMSVGLQYLPGVFTPTEEMIRLYKIVAKYDGIMMVHLRNHDYTMLKSFEEAVKISRESGVKLHISHMRSYGSRKWGVSAKKLLQALEDARKSGIDVTFDQHHYVAGSTLLTQVLPPWVTEGSAEDMAEKLKDPKVIQKLRDNFGKQDVHYDGWDDYGAITGWDKIMITSVSKDHNKQLEGKTVTEIGDIWNKDPFDTVAKLLIDEKGGVGIVNVDVFSEEDIDLLMKHPLQMVGSDSIPAGVPHPRLYGNFPRYIGKFVRDKKVISIEEAIYKATLLPARRLGMLNRGSLEEGKASDIIVFDLKEIQGFEEYRNPRKPPVGMKYVVVNGKLAFKNGKSVSSKFGKVLKYK